MKKAVVLLPTLNEKDNIYKFTQQVLSVEKKIEGWSLEVLIADSNSTDGTYEIIKELERKNPKVHVITVGAGLGTGTIEGHKYAIEKFSPDALIQLDADGQVEANIISKLLDGIDEGYDLVIGSRMIKGGENRLSFIRRLFTWGSSMICRFVMGPFDIKEFTNSTRAFTPELFKKINLKRLPWQEKTYIIQPAFLNEAVLAGAKYKEVPLIFKNREEGYSKNKVFNYTYDVVTYAIDARLHKWGFQISFFKMTRRAKTLVKFGLVGFTGTFVDFLFYKLFIWFFALTPATSKAFSAEMAIVNNFMLNNFWTFKYRKTKTNIWQKFGLFNVVSLGGLIIGALIVKFLHDYYGDGFIYIGNRPVAYNNFFFFATIPPVMIWNFTVNHFVTWRHKEE